jgi:RNA polymerase sigma factor (sigma-70 family)
VEEIVRMGRLLERDEVSTDRSHDFDLIWRENKDLLWRSLYALSGGHPDIVDDALAEAFTRAIAHTGRIVEPAAWIYRTAARVVVAELKVRNARSGQRREDEVEDQDRGSSDLGELVWALRRLSPNQRSAVVLHYEMGLSLQEVARFIGTRTPTVRVHLFRARQRIRTLLGEERDASEEGSGA